MEALGFKSFNLGPEPEFSFSRIGLKMAIRHWRGDKGGYFMETDLADNTRREIVNVLTKMGFEVEAVTMVAVGRHGLTLSMMKC